MIFECLKVITGVGLPPRGVPVAPEYAPCTLTDVESLCSSGLDAEPGDHTEDQLGEQAGPVGVEQMLRR